MRTTAGLEERLCDGGSGMTLAPADTLTVIKSDPATDTPTAATGAVVCPPRVRVSDLRLSTLVLKPEPALYGPEDSF